MKENEPVKKVISDLDEHLTFLANIGKMAKIIAAKQGKIVKSFTRGTSLAIEHTWNCLIVDICKAIDVVLLGLVNLPQTI